MVMSKRIIFSVFNKICSLGSPNIEFLGRVVGAFLFENRNRLYAFIAALNTLANGYTGRVEPGNYVVELIDGEMVPMYTISPLFD